MDRHSKCLVMKRVEGVVGELFGREVTFGERAEFCDKNSYVSRRTAQ